MESAGNAAALAAALAAVFVLALQPLWATDVGWQIRLGRDLLARGVPAGIPQTDTFSWSMPGAAWIELRWLWALALAALERAGGFAAVSWGAAAAVTAAFALAAAAAWRGTTAAGGSGRVAWIPLVTLAAALAAQQRFLARPETFTFVAVGAALLVLHGIAPRHPRAVWVLPALQVLWVNTHTLFPLGPVLVAAWALAGVLERRGTLRRDALVLAATLAACLVNPYGPRAFSFALLLWSELRSPVVRAAISEIASPFTVAGAAGFTNLRWFVALLAAAVVVSIVALARRTRLDPFLAIVTGLGAGLALLSVRNLPLFALPAIPFLVHAASAGRGRMGRAATIAVPILAIALSAWTIADVARQDFYVRQGDPRRFGAGIAPARFPAGAATFLRAHGVEDRVFATFHESSWLLAEGFRSWLDPRIEVFGTAHLARTLQAQGDTARWRALVAEAHPSAVVAGLDHAAFEGVLARTGWELAWFDDVAAVWLPAASGAGDRESVLEAIVRTVPPPAHPDPPGARPSRLVGFLLRHDRPDLAAAYAGADDPIVAVERALTLLERGRFGDAAGLLDPILKRPDASARAWALRGEAYAGESRFAEAESCLARAVALDPGDAHLAGRHAAMRRRRDRETP